MNKVKLQATARKLAAKGKGILAADESSGTIEKRLASINVASSETNRRDWRELLFATKAMEKFISGVILYDETLRQKAANGTPFAKLLKRKGVIPGIKVDKGAKDLAGFAGEKVTEGLDGLRERLAEYRQLGAEFTKWRAVITIGTGMPTAPAIEVNAWGLAQFAALSQEAGLVPIVEPEVLMNGTHSLARHEAVTVATLKAVFAALAKLRVYLSGMLLKPNMVAAGLDGKTKSGPKAVAAATLRALKKAVPKSVPGIMFLSGGLTPEEATQLLQAINSAGKQPWELSYSFGRALQGEALTTWNGKKQNVAAAQGEFYKRAELVARARMGRL